MSLQRVNKLRFVKNAIRIVRMKAYFKNQLFKVTLIKPELKLMILPDFIPSRYASG